MYAEGSQTLFPRELAVVAAVIHPATRASFLPSFLLTICCSFGPDVCKVLLEWGNNFPHKSQYPLMG